MKENQDDKIETSYLQKRILTRIFARWMEMSRSALRSLVSCGANACHFITHRKNARNPANAAVVLGLILCGSNSDIRFLNLRIYGAFLSSQVRFLNALDRLINGTRQVVMIQYNVPNANHSERNTLSRC